MRSRSSCPASRSAPSAPSASSAPYSSSVLVVRGGLDQPEAGPDRAGRCLCRGPPGLQSGGELSRLGLVRGALDRDPVVQAGQRGGPALRDRDAGGPAAAARREQRPARLLCVQPGPGRGVGQRLQRPGEHHRGLGTPGLGRPAQRWHRLREPGRPPRVVPGQHGPPARHPAIAVRYESGQDATAFGQVGREPGHRRPVDRGPAGGRRVRARGRLAGGGQAGGGQDVQRGQDAQRGRGLEGQGRYPPAAERGPPPRARGLLPGGGPDQLGRCLRAICPRGQPQGQLIPGRFPGQVAGRFTEGGERSREDVGIRCERMRPGGAGRPPARRRHHTGRELRIFRPQAERAARPDPMDD